MPNQEFDRIAKRDALIPVLLGDDFVVRSERDPGASDSSHFVVFGTHPEHGEVAAKIFNSKGAVVKAQKEERLTGVVKGLGIATLRPAGVVVRPDLRASAFMTEYEPGLSAANTFAFEAEPGSERGAQVDLVAESISETLAVAHMHGVTLGDPQLKNFGYRLADEQDSDKIVAFDFEGGFEHPIRKPAAQFSYSRSVSRDFRRLVQALGRRQYGGPSHRVAEVVFTETVINPYTDMLHRDAAYPLVKDAIHEATEQFLTARKGYVLAGHDPATMV